MYTKCFFFHFKLAIFILAWSPYAIISMYSAFVDADASDGLYGTVPAIFAKSSMVWTPVFYIFLNKTIRSALFGKAFGFPTELSGSRGKTIKPKITIYILDFIK